MADNWPIRYLEQTERRLRQMHGLKWNNTFPGFGIELLKRGNLQFDWHPGEPVKLNYYSKDVNEPTLRVIVKTIWAFIAYLHPFNRSLCFLSNPDMVQRVVCSQDYPGIVEHALNSLAARLIKENRRCPLMMVPRVSGNKLIEVVSLDASYLVNKTQTVGDLYVERNVRGAGIKVSASLEKLEAAGGSGLVQQGIEEIQKNLSEFTSQTRSPVLSGFADDTASPDYYPDDGDVPAAEVAQV